jgi:alpha-tubulin suppressor-like RCC1 family protein/uncharacterized protein YkwD
MACADADTPSTQLAQLAAEEAVLCLVNEHRVASGAPELTLNTKLRTAARKHAQAAAALKWWAGGGPAVHVNPQTGSTPQSRIRDEGYCPVNPAAPVNENAYDAYYTGGVAYQQVTSPRAAVDWWMGSPPHRATLLDPTYRESGVAVVLGIAERGPEADVADGGAIFVQDFGGCDKPEVAVPTEAWTWGSDDVGQLGDGGTFESPNPLQPVNPTSVISVACFNHTLAIRADGTVWAWGANDWGQVGDGSTTDRRTPVQVANLDQVVVVSAGREHSLALRNDGTVWAWGRNRHGQLGDGTNTHRHTPVLVHGLGGVIRIAAGDRHSLALKSDGSAWAWGAIHFGELGIANLDDYVDLPTRVDTSTIASRLIAIAAGDDFSLGIEEGSGHVWAWGQNNGGQLGDGGSHPYTWRPLEVPHFGGAVAVAAGGRHSLALKNDKSVWGWGDNDFGQLGDDTTSPGVRPVQVHGLNRVEEIATGYFFSLARKDDGTVWAWGTNIRGELGDGTYAERHTPVQVGALRGAVSIDGGGVHSVAAAEARKG